MSVREQRGLGLPWSEVLVERGRRSVGGTVAAARRALEHGVGMNLGGGTHHAGRDFARGYCLFNDVAVTLAQLRARKGWRGGRSSSTATSTRATARRSSSVRILTRSRCRCTAHATTRSSGSRPTWTWTSRRGPATTSTCSRCRARLDVASPTRDADDGLLPRRRRPVGGRPPRPPVVDQGRSARAGRARPRSSAGTAPRSVVVLAGGYAPDIRDTVDINAATVAAVAARDGVLS